MKTINELQDEVIEEFSDFDDWMDKYQLLIDLGNVPKPGVASSGLSRRENRIPGRERCAYRERHYRPAD